MQDALGQVEVIAMEPQEMEACGDHAELFDCAGKRNHELARNDECWSQRISFLLDELEPEERRAF
jgi:hypothetical protein